MIRPNLRLIAGRPVPVLREECRTESLKSVLKRGFYSFTEAVFAGIAILAAVWAFAALVLSLEIVR